ncbi:hypothetical protein V7O61_10450 [Methanolobus sp. WCC1]|uniref:hypothetical protein n=1 Tax=unclassified Methanolobus TaxID=2629569 RepID=UPI00325000E8
MSASSENINDSVVPLLLQNTDQDLFTRLNIGVIYLDEHNRVLCSNKVLSDLTGFTAEDILSPEHTEPDLSSRED